MRDVVTCFVVYVKDTMAQFYTYLFLQSADGDLSSCLKTRRVAVPLALLRRFRELMEYRR